LATEQKIYADATNIVAIADKIAPALPQPIATPVEAILGVISAALAAWNAHQQQSIAKLRAGKCPLGAEPKPPALGPPLGPTAAQPQSSG
jgi:hypothetical protein